MQLCLCVCMCVSVCVCVSYLSSLTFYHTECVRDCCVWTVRLTVYLCSSRTTQRTFTTEQLLISLWQTQTCVCGRGSQILITDLTGFNHINMTGMVLVGVCAGMGVLRCGVGVCVCVSVCECMYLCVCACGCDRERDES